MPLFLFTKHINLLLCKKYYLSSLYNICIQKNYDNEYNKIVFYVIRMTLRRIEPKNILFLHD